MIWLFVGVLLVSLSLAYAWWTRVRVINLRQDIFDLRDELFVSAMALDQLDDPAHTSARDHLNAVAMTADFLTIPLLAYLLHAGVGAKQVVRSQKHELQRAIDDALEHCASRIAFYLTHETFTGIVILPLLRIVRLTGVVHVQTKRWIMRWLVSSSPEELESIGKARPAAEVDHGTGSYCF
jgi:hypothetical protein